MSCVQNPRQRGNLNLPTNLQGLTEQSLSAQTITFETVSIFVDLVRSNAKLLAYQSFFECVWITTFCNPTQESSAPSMLYYHDFDSSAVIWTALFTTRTKCLLLQFFLARGCCWFVFSFYMKRLKNPLFAFDSLSIYSTWSFCWSFLVLTFISWQSRVCTTPFFR